MGGFGSIIHRVISYDSTRYGHGNASAIARGSSEAQDMVMLGPCNTDAHGADQNADDACCCADVPFDVPCVCFNDQQYHGS